MKYYLSLLVSLSLFQLFNSCKSEPLVPKPKGYFRIEFPTQDSLIQFHSDDCNFSFKYPSYVQVERDTLFFDEKPEDPCWLNLKYPTLNAIVHLSYKSLGKNELYQLTEDYHRMKNKHVVKADYIDEEEIRDTTKHIYGLISQVGGDVASAYQFYITDSATNFVRGSLYFRNEPNADSLQPALIFVRDDIVEILRSWQWD